MIIVMSSLSKSSAFKMFSVPYTDESAKPAFSNSSGLKSVFENGFVFEFALDQCGR